jgi:hypothetical protein
VRLEPGSLIHPLLAMVWSEEPARALDVDCELALSPAIYADVEGWDSWRQNRLPLPPGAHRGRPDTSRPWVLLEQPQPALRSVLEAAGLEHAQIHALDLRSPSPRRGDVTWPPTRRVVASLLGHVDAVVAAPGPLAWDAVRCGARLLTLPARGERPALDRRLASVVPATLGASPAFWRSVALALLDGVEPTEWGTRAWMLRAREPSRDGTQPARGQRLLKRLMKLRRDPAAFWEDSWLARHTTGRRTRSRRGESA